MKQISMPSLFLGAWLLLSCSKKGTTHQPGSSDPGNTPTKAYTISGTIKNAAGQPVKAARIRIENPNGNNIHYTTTSNDQGKYSVTVSAIGGYKIYAWKETEKEGQVYQVRLGMEKETDYDAFSVPPSGVVKNFVWQLSGRIPDRTISKENGTGYFGGSIKFINYNAVTEAMPAGTEITITLTPVTPATFLDGSDAGGKVIEKKFTIADGVGQAYYINDIPATRYRITATSLRNGVKKELRIGSGSPDELKNTAEYYFRSEGGSGSYENGLLSPNEYYFYLGQP